MENFLPLSLFLSLLDFFLHKVQTRDLRGSSDEKLTLRIKRTNVIIGMNVSQSKNVRTRKRKMRFASSVDRKATKSQRRSAKLRDPRAFQGRRERSTPRTFVGTRDFHFRRNGGRNFYGGAGRIRIVRARCQKHADRKEDNRSRSPPRDRQARFARFRGLFGAASIRPTRTSEPGNLR